MMNKVTPAARSLRWLGDTQRKQLAAYMHDACMSVVKMWRAPDELALISVRAVNAFEGVNDGWNSFRISAKSDPLLTIQLAPDALRHLLLLPMGVFSPSPCSSMLFDVEKKFVEALAKRIAPDLLAHQLQVEKITRAMDSSRFHQLMELSADRQQSSCGLILETTLLDHLLPRTIAKPSDSLLPRRLAIHEYAVELTAQLGQIEVPFRDLRSLAPGDVLVMKSSLTAPVVLCNSQGQSVATGTLGQRNHQRAVQLSSVAATGQAGSLQATKRSIR